MALHAVRRSWRRALASGAVARFWLSAVGSDRPGIVAAVTGALVDVGANLEDSTMTILQDQFAILLLVSVGDDVGAEQIDAALAPVAHRFDLLLSVRPLASVPARAPAVSEDAEAFGSWQVAVHGADRPGIVHAVAEALAARGGNIVDLATHLVGESDAPAYVLTMRVALPTGAAGEDAADDVRQAAAALGVHCTVRHDESDLL